MLKMIRSSRTFYCTLLRHRSTSGSRVSMAEAAESLTASSTPSNESTHSRRKVERAHRFLSGTSRAAYRLEPLLERSLSASMLDTSQGTESDSEDDGGEVFTARQTKRRENCKRGCPTVLERLAKTYENYGKHTGKTAQYRRTSYPNPSNPGTSPRNITGN